MEPVTLSIQIRTPLLLPFLSPDLASKSLQRYWIWYPENMPQVGGVCGGKEGLLFSPRDMCGCEVHWCEPVSQHENEAAYMILRSSFCSMWDNDTKGGIL